MTFANMHYDYMFARPAAEMLGDGWASVILPEDLERYTAAFQTRTPFRTETRVRDRDGRVRWLRCEGVPRTDDAGTFLGYTGCNVDITEAPGAKTSPACSGLQRPEAMRPFRTWGGATPPLAVVGRGHDAVAGHAETGRV